MSTPLTKENQEGISYFYHKELVDSRNNPLRVHRNGKTKTWKRSPERFQIPVKYGLYDYFYITEKNSESWSID